MELMYIYLIAIPVVIVAVGIVWFYLIWNDII